LSRGLQVFLFGAKNTLPAGQDFLSCVLDWAMRDVKRVVRILTVGWVELGQNGQSCHKMHLHLTVELLILF
jgi:hypothetical protein